MTQVDRRKAVRVPARLAMEIKIGDGAEKVESLNVSANGVYFMTKYFIDPLTRLEIVLDLPDAEGVSHSVTCVGVVVRTQPDTESEIETEYNIACYFTEVSEGDQDTLESYILRQMVF